MEARIAAWDVLWARSPKALKTKRMPPSASLPSTPKTSLSSLFAKEDAAAVAAALLAALAKKKSEDEAATKAAAAKLSLKHQLEREREARRERYKNAAAAAALPRRRIGLIGEVRGVRQVRTLRQVRGVAPRVATEPRCLLPPILAHVLSPDALRVKRESYLRRLVREDTVRRLAYAPTQADTAPLAFKLSTSRQTNMSRMTYAF